MAALSGATGSVTVVGGGQTTLITRWTCSIERDIHDISNFDNSTNERTKLGGMMDLKGTVEGTVNDAAMPDIATQMQAEDSTGTPTFVLLTKAGKSYTFTALISNISMDVPKGGVQTFTMAFESSGAIVVA